MGSSNVEFEVCFLRFYLHAKLRIDVVTCDVGVPWEMFSFNHKFIEKYDFHPFNVGY